LCLNPHDLAIPNVARREKDIVFNRELATRGIVKKEQLSLLRALQMDCARFSYRKSCSM
jgi:hypothetical protein